MIFCSGSIIACSRKVAPVVFNPVWQKPTQKSLDLAYSNFLRENLSFCSFLHETADWTFFKQKGEVGSGIHPQEWIDHILSYSLEIWISWKTIIENFRWCQKCSLLHLQSLRLYNWAYCSDGRWCLQDIIEVLHEREKVYAIFQQMEREVKNPDMFRFVWVLNACWFMSTWRGQIH
jgi:hypothetical protein